MSSSDPTATKRILRITFTDGSREISKSDAAFCYTVGNPGMRAGDLVVIRYTRAGRISHMGPTS